MRAFTAVDLTPQCEVQLRAVYQYELLEQLPGAAKLIGSLAGEIWRAPEQFDLPGRDGHRVGHVTEVRGSVVRGHDFFDVPDF